MECEFYTTESGAENSERIHLANGKNIQFSQNSKAETPKFSVKVYEDKQLVCHLGSVFREEIDMTSKALKQLAIAYADDITFLSRAKQVVSGNLLILGLTESQFERVLAFINEEFN